MGRTLTFQVAISKPIILDTTSAMLFVSLDIRRVFDGFHFEALDIRYSNTDQRQGKAQVTGELVIMNWGPAALGGLF